MAVRREVFTRIQRAYAYLGNSVTKLIYDTHGIPGLIVYDAESKNYEELAEEYRTLEGAAEIMQDADHEQKRRRCEYQILAKTMTYLKKQVKTSAAGYHQRSLQIEFYINAKAFCNHYSKFYHAGHSGQIMKLLKHKYFHSTLGISIPFSPSHTTTITL